MLLNATKNQRVEKKIQRRIRQLKTNYRCRASSSSSFFTFALDSSFSTFALDSFCFATLAFDSFAFNSSSFDSLFFDFSSFDLFVSILLTKDLLILDLLFNLQVDSNQLFINRDYNCNRNRSIVFFLQTRTLLCCTI